jgi:hypothetical protein
MRRPPNEEYFPMAFFGFLVVGLYFLGKISRRKRQSHYGSVGLAVMVDARLKS